MPAETPLEHMRGMEFIHEENGACKVCNLHEEDSNRTRIVFRYSPLHTQSVIVKHGQVEEDLAMYGFERV